MGSSNSKGLLIGFLFVFFFGVGHWSRHPQRPSLHTPLYPEPISGDLS